MEKIKIHIISTLILLTLGFQNYSQEWISSLQLDYSVKTLNYDTNQIVIPQLVFPSRTYDNSFSLKNNSISGISFFIGMGNDINFKNNIITTSISLGFHSYQYGMKIDNTDSLNIFSSDSSLTSLGDQEIWNGIIDSKTNQFEVNKIVPTIRFSIGFKREILRFKSLVPIVETGMQLERRFNTSTYDSIVLYQPYPYVYSILNDQFNHRNFLFLPYVGAGLRIGPHTLGARLNFGMSRVDDGLGVLNLSENYFQINYSKVVGLNKIAKEQVIYDEYQFLALAKSSEYRKGDKYSFMNIGFTPSKRINYKLNNPIITEEVFENDSLTNVVQGNSVTPAVNLGFSFNTYATHRWMIGLGFDFYQEFYNTYGYVYDSISGTTTNYEVGENPNFNENIYSKFTRNVMFAPSMNSAVYFSKRVLKIDPYIKGTAAFLVNYDTPSFLIGNQKLNSLAIFTYYRIGLGADVRLRVKSSKYLMFGFMVDYNINPHMNFVQYSIKLGYYRKKKIKNQTY